jgi:hypothetical protein
MRRLPEPAYEGRGLACIVGHIFLRDPVSTSAPLPRFVIYRSDLGSNFGFEALVPLIDLKFLNELAATAAGTSNRRL